VEGGESRERKGGRRGGRGRTLLFAVVFAVAQAKRHLVFLSSFLLLVFSFPLPKRLSATCPSCLSARFSCLSLWSSPHAAAGEGGRGGRRRVGEREG